MNVNILNKENQQFINTHLDSNISELILKGTSLKNIQIKELIEQIESKKRCQKKLPIWYHHKNIYYPNKLNIEQTSSEITAGYKASLIQGKTMIDLTGGFGVDSYYFSKQFEVVTYCEINSELSEIVNHNYKQLDTSNIEVYTIDGLDYLRKHKTKFDWIYIDPSRRSDSKGKVFFLEDCLPNVPSALDLLLQYSNNVMVKTSPLLDISIGIKELKHVKEVHIVAINNEVKELLWILQKNHTSKVHVESVNIKSNDAEKFKFTLSDEPLQNPTYALPSSFLYEPNGAILKGGAFNSIATQLNLSKLHKHTHLYTSEQRIEFPGRTFVIENVYPYNLKIIKKMNIQKANITTRNFPETVQQLRNKLKIKDGGNLYMFFATNMLNEKVVIICSKIN